MKWLIKLLGGYTQNDFDILAKEYTELVKKLENKLENKYNLEKRKADKYYKSNYRARKYLETIKPSNMWKKHYNKILELLN